MGQELPIEVLKGPIGSGKSAACCIRIFCHALEQPPGADGWRRSRWAVIRNTNPMLETTTIQTWLDWFPEQHFGKFNWAPPYSHVIRLEEQKVELEMWFIPLDRPDQVKNLLSMEITGAWVNEAREVPREIVVAARSRCGRFPSLRSGAEPGWAGVICDTNEPEDDLHYLRMWAGQAEPPEWMDRTTRGLMFKPAGIKVYSQAPALTPVRDKGGAVTDFLDNPKAENLKNLRPGYYRSQLAGQRVAWVLNMLCCEPAHSGPTRPAQPEFREAQHVAEKRLAWEPQGGRLLFGADFARNPAVVVAQEQEGVAHVLAELVGQNVSVEVFWRDTVIPFLNDRWPSWRDSHHGWGDPSGGNRTGADDNTAFRVVQGMGVKLYPCFTNDPEQRQGALERRFRQLVAGAPAIRIDPRCHTLIAGLKGGYRYRKLQGQGESFSEEIEKNLYSHICEAAEYLFLGLDRTANKDEGDRRRAAREHQQPNGRVRVDPFAVARAIRARRGR